MVNGVVGDVIGASRSSGTKCVGGTKFDSRNSEGIIGGCISGGSLPKGQFMLGSMTSGGRRHRFGSQSEE